MTDKEKEPITGKKISKTDIKKAKLAAALKKNLLRRKATSSASHIKNPS